MIFSLLSLITVWPGLVLCLLSFPVKHWGEGEVTHLWSNRKCVGHGTEVTEARGSVPAFCGAGEERNGLPEPRSCLRLHLPKQGGFHSNCCCLRTLIKVCSIVLMCPPKAGQLESILAKDRSQDTLTLPAVS